MGGGLAGVFVMAGLDPIGRPPHPAHCVRRPLPAWRGEMYYFSRRAKITVQIRG